MAKRFYLAYGSNLNMEQMQRRCPGARPVGTAMLHDHQLLYRGSRTGSYLTVEPREGAQVPVGVWEVTKRNEDALDRYEGYPAFYYKEELPIDTGDGSEAVAFIYKMHENRPLGLPSPFYVDVCREGYRDFGFEEDYLDQAFDFTKGAMK